MPNASYAVKVNNARLMLSGLSANMEELSKIRAIKESVDDLKVIIDKVIKLKAEQERLKVQLKLKTNELNTEVENMQSIVSRAKVIVKVETPQAKWTQFGIKNKR